MPLKNLLLDDLLRFSTDTSAVASEESIRLLMDIHRIYGMLVNPSLVEATQLSDLFTRIHKQKGPSHSQLIVEYNTRSLIAPRIHTNNDYSVHYAAMDVFCDEHGDLLVFIADHYFGKEYKLSKELQQLKLPIFFVIAGGSPYQNDSSHCPIFSLQHLLLSAKDNNMHIRLHEMVKSITEHSSYTLAWKNENPVIDKNIIHVEIKKSKLQYSIFDQENSSRKCSGEIALRKLNPDFNPDVTIEELTNHLPNILRETARNGHTPRSINLPWIELEPRYNIYPQSITQLTKYIDHVTSERQPRPFIGPVPDHIVNFPKPALVNDRFDVHLGQNIVFFDDTSDVQNVYINECHAKVLLSDPLEDDFNLVMKKKGILFIRKGDSIQAGFCGNDNQYHQINVEDAGIEELVRTYDGAVIIKNKAHLRDIVIYMRSLGLSMKPHNNGIEHLTLDYAKFAAVSLDFEGYTEEKLIDVCYKERYPFVAELLKSGLDVCKSTVNIDPLLNFVFFNQFVLNCFSIDRFSNQPSTPQNSCKRRLAEFLSNLSLVDLITMNKIDVYDLFHEITYVDQNKAERIIDAKKLNVCVDNSSILDLLVDLRESQPSLSINSTRIIELLCSSETGKLLQIEPIKRLYFSGDIDHKALLSIKPTQVPFLERLNYGSYEAMSNAELKDHIEQSLCMGSPVSINEGCLTPSPFSQEFSQGFFSPRGKKMAVSNIASAGIENTFDHYTLDGKSV